MGWFEWSAQLLLILLLLAALPFIIRLERGLAAVRRDRLALEASAAGLGDATRLAEAAFHPAARLGQGCRPPGGRETGGGRADARRPSLPRRAGGRPGRPAGLA